MKYEEAQKYLEENEENEGEYLIDGKCLVKGLLLIEKYQPIKEVAAEHDIIYLSDFIEEMSKEDILQLHKWGFHLSEDSWAYFT